MTSVRNARPSPVPTCRGMRPKVSNSTSWSNRSEADNIAATFCRPVSEPLTPHVVRPATVVPVLTGPVVGLSDGKCYLTDDAEASLFDQDQIGRDWVM